MNAVRRAVIDVGTNSVKLLVADVTGSKAHPVWEVGHQTRLGKGLFRDHFLTASAITATAQAVADYVAKAREHEAVSIRAIATSAARDARNAGDLVEAVRSMAGLELEIISGEQEARFAFQGVTTDESLGAEPLLVLDLGGGSTEMVLGMGQEIRFSASFRIGTVRLLEMMPHGDPPTPDEREAARSWVRQMLGREVLPVLGPHLAQLPGHQFAVIATGGTASILGCLEAGLKRFDRHRLDGLEIPAQGMRRLNERLWSLPLAARRSLPGLPPERADVILMGATIYEGILERLERPCMHVSTRGLRFAAVLDPAEGQ
jgi:exopolyphosphatase/guanosine-5'-triphosphate,3'-diphosphate pyrophosphatase